MVTGYITGALAWVGNAVQELIVAVPFLAALFMVLAVLFYWDEVRHRRLACSRIVEIDELSTSRYRNFVRLLLTWNGFEDEKIIEKAEEEKGADESRPKKEPQEGKNPKEEEGQKKEKLTKKEETPPWKDDVDAVVSKDGAMYAVIIVKKNGRVGKALFNRLENAVKSHGCQGGIIVSNGFFSEKELREGRTRKIKMWDRKELVENLLQVQGFEGAGRYDFLFYFKDFWRWLVQG